MKKKIIITLVAVVFVGLIIFFMRSNKNEQPYTQSQVVQVDVHKTINVDATMTPTVYADISSELPTLIKSVDVSVNDEVKKGQELFRLDKKSI